MNMQKSRRLIVALVAAVMLLAVAPVPASAQQPSATAASESDAVTRLWGPHRYATSLAIAEAVAEQAGGKLDTAVVVSGLAWTDAVTAAPLAGKLRAPVILAHPRNGISGNAEAFLKRSGVRRIVAIGSVAGLSDGKLGGSGVERISVDGPEALSVAVAQKMGAPGGLRGFGSTVIVASAEVFADALSAGPLAAKARIPILLTDPDTLHPDVRDYIAAKADHVIIMGGTAAISQAVENAISDIDKANTAGTKIVPKRIGGKDRFDTAAKFAEFAGESYADRDCFDGTVAGLATGGKAADAFSSAPLLARLCAPLTLTFTGSLPAVTETYLQRTDRLYVFGGTAAVSDAAVAQWEPATAVRAKFRRWDHQALVDLPLWAHCPPELKPAWLTERIAGYDATWAGWDTAAIELSDGRLLATGWMTDEQIGRWLPGSGITAEEALANLVYRPDSDTVTIWEGLVTMHVQGHPANLPTLQAAMRHRGVYGSSFPEQLAATVHGVSGSGRWPADLHLGLLLSDWVRFRYAQPPTLAEPVAWPLWTLFKAKESTCVAEALVAMCASDEQPPAMLTPTHPIGRVLRSLACAE